MIRTKREFYRLWNAGLLGNRPRTWHSLMALTSSDFQGEVTIRNAEVPGWRTQYRVPVNEAILTAPPGSTFNESAPDLQLTFQGEVTRREGGLYLRFDCTPNLKMKEAMACAKDAYGLTAKLLLDRYLWPSSRDDLDALLDLYPDHVIEFSAYDRAVGDRPHRNTLIWEVRAY
jgi:hypothetical protein